MPSNVLPLRLKQTFPPIIWIFTEGDEIKSRLPFKIFSTLMLWAWMLWTWISWINVTQFPKMCGSFIAQVHLTDFLYFLYRNDPGQPVQLNCWFRFITRTVNSFRGNPCNGLSNCTTTSRVNLYNCWIRRRNRPHFLCNFSCNGSSNCTTTAVSLYCATVESEGEPSTLFEGISATARATLTAAVMSRVKLYI